MLVLFFLMTLTVVFLISTIFFMLSKKTSSDLLASSVFECGFSSYYFSRFSFSMHYFVVGLVFLFLDLELCFIMPFFSENFPDFKFMSFFWIFMAILILGLLEEWHYKVLDWKF